MANVDEHLISDAHDLADALRLHGFTILRVQETRVAKDPDLCLDAKVEIAPDITIDIDPTGHTFGIQLTAGEADTEGFSFKHPAVHYFDTFQSLLGFLVANPSNRPSPA